MTDAELNALEKAAKIAKGRSGEKDFFGINSELAIFYAMASPETILELIAELRQARAERDWLARTFGDMECPPSRRRRSKYEWANEYCKMTCEECWLEVAKEATSCQK